MPFTYPVIHLSSRRGINVPTGLIVLYNDTIIPSGWTRFSSADDKYIIGAGNSYNIGDTGGSLNYSISTNTTGSHEGSVHPNTEVLRYEGTVGPRCDNTIDGGHSHTLSGEYYPKTQRILLIKASETHNNLPEKTVILSYKDFTGLSNISNDGSFLKSTSSIGTDSENISCTVGTSGSHIHSSALDLLTGHDIAAGAVYSGDHVHSISSLIPTQLIKRAVLRALTKLSAFDFQKEMIGLWDQATLPSGWKLCDGTNDTIDLRDAFIQFDSLGDGTLSGNNTLSISASLSSNTWSHQHHYLRLVDSGPTYDFGKLASVPHSHDVNSSTSYVPPYYALKFITPE